MEAADDTHWAKGISRQEALIAAHYSVCELNGFPAWLGGLFKEFPDIVDEVITDELGFELRESSPEKSFIHTLSALRYGDEGMRERYNDLLLDLVSAEEPANDQVLESVLDLVLARNQDPDFRRRIVTLASDRFRTSQKRNRKVTWLSVLLCLDGTRAIELLRGWIADHHTSEEQKELMVSICASLTDYRDPRFGNIMRDYERVEVLNELIPLIYSYVRIEDDAHHDDVYTPNARDDAERTRSHLLGIIINTPGRQSYDALANLAESAPTGYFKDRLNHLAKERAAQNAEPDPWPGAAVAEFALSAMKHPRSEADLYNITLSRLDDLKTDIEDGDESMAELLLELKKEPKVRTFFANQLRQLSRSYYTVGSEEELADATRTDIRLNAPQVLSPVPIELKIADKCSLAQLRERMENQLIGQYMRVSQYGVFLVVHNGRKINRWKDSRDRKLLHFPELVGVLKQDASDLVRKYPSISALEVIGIDFTARGRHKTVGTGDILQYFNNIENKSGTSDVGEMFTFRGRPFLV